MRGTKYHTRTAIILLSTAAVLFNLIIILVRLWVAGEGPTIEWSHLPRKIVRGKRLSVLLRQKILGNIKLLEIRLGFFPPQEEDLFISGQIVEER